MMDPNFVKALDDYLLVFRKELVAEVIQQVQHANDGMLANIRLYDMARNEASRKDAVPRLREAFAVSIVQQLEAVGAHRTPWHETDADYVADTADTIAKVCQARWAELDAKEGKDG